ncbi:MAG TPA: hypothetical protein VH253_00005 [Phycisphaerae bacterium]|nr:hypothetical protein [Phycisphaerae bacterium]
MTAALPTPLSPADAPPKSVATLNVHTCVGHSHVDLTITCLSSLLRFSADPLSIIIHEDGSLTPDDRARLDAALHHPRIIDRKTADAQMHELLRPFPNLQRFRAANFFAIKILDVSLLTSDPLIAYCDCDILFLKPFKNLYHIPPGAGGIMMHDFESAYSIRSWHLLAHPSLRLAKDVNAGLVCLHRSSLDLHLLERFLSLPCSSTKKYFTEQTSWALLAHHKKFHLYHPRHVCFPRPPIPDSAIALHVVASSRSQLPTLLAQRPSTAPCPPAAIPTLPARRCRFHHLAAYETQRILSRLSKKLRKP